MWGVPTVSWNAVKTIRNLILPCKDSQGSKFSFESCYPSERFTDWLLPFVDRLLPLVDGLLPFIGWLLSFVDWLLPFVDWLLPFDDWLLPFVDWLLPFVDWLTPFVDWLLPFVDWLLPFVQGLQFKTRWLSCGPCFTSSCLSSSTLTTSSRLVFRLSEYMKSSLQWNDTVFR